MIWDILIPVFVGIVMLALGVLIGYTVRKKTAEAKITSAEIHAQKIMDDAVVAAEAKRKEMLVEAKEDILKAKTEAERENLYRHSEMYAQRAGSAERIIHSVCAVQRSCPRRL